MAKRVKIGDIMQILTSEGISYAQVTHRNPKYGYLIMVFPGTYPKVPKDFNEVVDQTPQFSAFFPLQPATHRGYFAIVANVPVSSKNEPFPVFRSGHRDRDGRRANWWLWDGEKATRLDRPLTETEKRFPTDGIISAPLLIERIEKGYRAEIDDV